MYLPQYQMRTLQHLWFPLLVFGGVVEYPLYIILGLQSKYTTMVLLFLFRKTLQTMLKVLKSNSHPLAQLINFVDLPATPWFTRHPEHVRVPDSEEWTTTQFIQLGHPHGLFTVIGSLYGGSRTYPPKTVVLVDPWLYILSPVAIAAVEYITVNLTVSYLRHTNIFKLLRS